MSRPSLVILALGILALVALWLSALAGTAIMPSYLGAWLFILALPLGALPVVMGLELMGSLKASSRRCCVGSLPSCRSRPYWPFRSCSKRKDFFPPLGPSATVCRDGG